MDIDEVLAARWVTGAPIKAEAVASESATTRVRNMVLILVRKGGGWQEQCEVG